MMINPRDTFRFVALAAGLLTLGGCVERTLKIDSDPQGARVFLNDKEVGVTPVKVAFLWYGDYDVALRKPGFATVNTHYRLDPPWYQYPPIDLVAECLIPTTIKDERTLPVYGLEPLPAPDPQDVVQRAVEMREAALRD